MLDVLSSLEDLSIKDIEADSRFRDFEAPRAEVEAGAHG